MFCDRSMEHGTIIILTICSRLIYVASVLLMYGMLNCPQDIPLMPRLKGFLYYSHFSLTILNQFALVSKKS